MRFRLQLLAALLGSIFGAGMLACASPVSPEPVRQESRGICPILSSVSEAYSQDMTVHTTVRTYAYFKDQVRQAGATYAVFLTYDNGTVPPCVVF